MNSMYEILAKLNSVGKQNLTEGKRPDFPDVDRDGDRKEPISKAAQEVNEADQKPKIIKKNGKPVGEVGIDPDAPSGRPGQYYMKHYASGTDLGGYDSFEEAMSELKYALSQEVNEADMGEGNEFTGARTAAIRAGKPTFTVAGKTYRVSGDTRDEKQQVDEVSADLLNRSMHAAYGKAADAKEKGHGQAAKIHTSQASRFKDAYATKAKAQRKQDDIDSLSMAKRRKAGLAEEDQLDEREMKDKDEFDQSAEPGDYYKTSTRGRVTKTKTGTRHERRSDDDDTGSDDDYDEHGNRRSGSKKSAAGEKRGRGRPKGSKRAIGAKGPTGKSKLLKRDSIRENDKEKSFPDYKGPRDEYGDPDDGAMWDYRSDKQREEEDDRFWDRHHDDLRREDRDPEADAGEYGREGDMAKEQLHTIEAAAEELSSILSDEQDLPEWVQKKITLAKEYVDSARDYMLSQGSEEPMVEKAPPGAKAERMVKHIKKGYAKDGKLTDKEKSIAYATAWKARKAGKVEEEGKENKKDEKQEKPVKETTTSGSVATADAAPAKGKKGMVFGKGVYEGQLAESYDAKLKSVLTEGMSMNMSVGEDGKKSLTVSATDEDAVKLAEILKLAGIEQSHGHDEACASCGGTHAGECGGVMEEDLANSPDPQYADTDTMVNRLAGGVNGPKRQINPNNMADNPMAMRDLGKGPYKQINLGEAMQQVQEETEQRLAALYKQYRG